MEETSQNQASSKETLQKRFENERKEYKERIDELTKKMNNMYTLSEVMVEALSLRQVILDYSHTLMDMLVKLNADYKKKRKDRRYYYNNECDERFSDRIIEQNIDVDLEKDRKIVDTFNNHLSYMKGTIETIDKLLYAVNWRMKLEEYKVGSKIGS